MLVIILFRHISYAQTTNISGTINTYIDVMTFGPCPNQLDVSNSAGFAGGDVVLIIQMKGATIDETNTAAFGTVTAYNGSGRFEKATIASIAGNTIYFVNDLVNTYNAPAGKVQMISIPQYVDVDVNGVLSSSDWNGTTGGVLVFEATGNVVLNANIDLTGRGFLGGNNLQVCPNSCNFTTNEANYYYPIGNYRGAPKGEGIAAFIINKEHGRGAQANGGGGGNDHNNGGAGGGNYAAGGVGGNNAEPGAFNCKGQNNYGRSGWALGFGAGPGRVFLGGGGGAGQGNNGATGGCPNNGNSGSGGDGGGIVIIGCNTFNGNGYQIISRGNNGGGSNADGAGGGGSGGVVCLNIAGSFSVPALTIDVRGGIGGNANGSAANRCYGPGGGGGGGVVYSSIALPGSFTVNAVGGAAGIVVASTNACNGTSTTALAGSNGNGIIGFTLPAGTIPAGPGCLPLPIELLSFYGDHIEQANVLHWTTASETNNLGFYVEHSLDCITFQSRGFVEGAGNSNTQQYYSFADAYPEKGIHYYRLKQMDINGSHSYSPILSIQVNDDPETILYPNPTHGIIYFKGQSLENMLVMITNNTGATVKSIEILNGSIDLSDLSPGIYHLLIPIKGYTIRKLITLI